MKTITINLDQTLADLEEEEELDFSRDLDDVGGDAENWFVVAWHRTWEGDVVCATCCTGKNNNLFTFYGISN